MRRLPHVTWLRAFEAAARHSSFTSAAEELNFTPAAVSQQIRLLEQHLGVQLFKRLAKGVELTDMGQAYALPIRKSFQAMQTATDGLFRHQRGSLIRVRSSISFAALILAPRLNEFRELHPDIEIELSTTVWADRMNDASIDLDIRYGDGNWPEQNIHPLALAPATIVCHPDYARHIAGAPPEETLPGADIVQVVGSETDWDRWFERNGYDRPAPTHWMRADSSLIALQILSAGHGCAIISRSFARHALDSGALVAPFTGEMPMQERFSAVERNHIDSRDDVLKIIDWLNATPL
ncbi:LysR substrate-binding domain-containing protein [Roseovarius sp. S4756]|uniref:LysR substrate-binding domain-containing protein n=1 Tax=Roseovarius maritimus TaxID=3342637 RepID=UPI00372C263D